MLIDGLTVARLKLHAAQADEGTPVVFRVQVMPIDVGEKRNELLKV